MGESASAENQVMINLNEISESQREANSPSDIESQNGEVDRDANASIGNEHQDRVLANHITQMLEESSEPPLSPKCCIYRVPHYFRKLNEEAYTPQFISIGPFHHGDTRLETYERVKVRYFKRFKDKFNPNMEDLVSFIRVKEEEVRHCYAETSKLSSDNYVKMILLDASFIILLASIIHQVGEWPSDRELMEDTKCLTEKVSEDMLLLENQLPFFVFNDLFDYAFPSQETSFTELIFQLFDSYNTRKILHGPNLEIKHFVDLLRTFYGPPSQTTRGEKVTHLYSASELDKAGVKFKVGSSKCLFDFKFTNGVLEIPFLKLNKKTELLFRNLVAFEQCHYLFEGYVTDYFRILDFLINTANDVDLLVQERILVNGLGDNNAMTTMVNNLCTQIAYIDMNVDYYNLSEALNNFYKDPRHSWKATLRRDYFGTPWRTASTIAAIILLVLTFTQTVCSILPLLKI